MFRHIVMWRLDGDDAPSRRDAADRVIAAMQPLPAVITSIRAMRLDVNQIRPEENADLVLTMDFDDRDGFEHYRDHPRHHEAGAVIKPLYRSRLAVDFEER